MMGLLSEVEQKDPTILLNGFEGDIDSLLDYYIKGEDGKFYDKKDIEFKTPVDLLPTGAFLKSKIESVIYGAKKQNLYTPQLEQIKEKIKRIWGR